MSVRGGNEATAIHDHLRPVVERTVRRLLGAGDRDHEDVAQLAMIEVVFTIDRFRNDCPVEAWAIRVASNVVFNHLRRRSTERRIFETSADEADALSPQSLGSEAVARQTLGRVLAHLHQLGDQKAEAYVLHDVCGYDLREVAATTDSTVAAAQTRLSRGRRELRALLEADAELGALLAEAA